MTIDQRLMCRSYLMTLRSTKSVVQAMGATPEMRKTDSLPFARRSPTAGEMNTNFRHENLSAVKVKMTINERTMFATSFVN